MSLTLKSNANFDTAAALVAPPYGPLTRVGDMPDLDYNSNRQIEVTSALGATLFISYDEMTNALVADKILREAHSTNNFVDAGYRFHQLLNVMFYHAAPMDDAAWYTPTEFKKLVRMIRFFEPIFALLPITSFREWDGSSVEVNPSFTEDETLLVTEFTNTTEGDAEFYLWDFGDPTTGASNFSILPGFDPDPVTHTFSGAGTYTVKLTAVGPGGIKTFALTFAVVAS